MTEPKKIDDQEPVNLTTEEDETLKGDLEPKSDTEPDLAAGDGGDTDPDTPDGDKPDGDTDPDTPADDISKVMTELGLDKTYADPMAALRAVPEQMKALTQAHTSNAEMRQILTELAKSRTDASATDKEPDLPSNEELIEEFNLNPMATFRKMAKSEGYVRGEDLGQLTSEVENTAITVRRNSLAQGVESLKGLEDVAPFLKEGHTPKPGFNAVWDAMDAEYRSDPAYQELSYAQAIPILHKIVQGANGGASAPAGDDPPVPAVSLSKKAEASTTGSGAKGAGLLEDGTPDFTLPKWTDEKIKAYHIKHGLYG